MSRSTSRPSSSKGLLAREPSQNNKIDKLDYHPGGRPLLAPDEHNNHTPSSRPSQDTSYAGSFFENVASGIVENERSAMRREVTRYLSFIWALLMCLCAGSITSYSLYAPLFQKHLNYSQLQVNGVSITAELGMYLPVPIWGYSCDRFGPGPPSLLSGLFFGVGYLLAAFTYKSGPPVVQGGGGWPYAVMVLAFVGVGMGTSCMYLSAVTTCAKNFGRGKYKGVALALPIAAFGLSGMWQSQVGSRLLYERTEDGDKGDVDVHRFFLFLGLLLLSMGVIGTFALRIVDEGEMIDEAVDELEQSGLLEDSEFFQPHDTAHRGYGTLPDNHERRLSAEDVDELHQKAAEQRARKAEEARKKTWLLNEETRRFLSDRTMWFLAAGFFLVTGPGEAFINNLGTIIGTLYPDPIFNPPQEGSAMTSAATHVSLVAITSTVARIFTGTLTDLLAPTSSQHQHRRGPNSLAGSIASLSGAEPAPKTKGLEISRLTFLLAFSLLLSLGQVILASGVLQDHGNLFWIVSSCIGAGYGAAFSLTPIIISVVWGVENFGTNWGIVATMPAAGATVYSLLYSGVYDWATEGTTGNGDHEGDGLCHGNLCYAPTFWIMACSVWVACGLWVYAWRGPDGWLRRGILV